MRGPRAATFRFRSSGAYFSGMPDRLRHAIRFAVTTLAAVYVLGVAWELFDVFARGDVAEGLTAGQTFAFNERVWRIIAAAEAVTVFLLRVGDVHDRPPTWPFAWEHAAWLGVTSVAVAIAIEAGRWAVAVGVAVAAAAIWLGLHRRLPGWPGAQADGADGRVGRGGERELP